MRVPGGLPGEGLAMRVQNEHAFSQTFSKCTHEGDVNEAMHIQTKSASGSRFAQQVEGDDQLRS